MTLTIHRWSDIFENADTRKRQRLKFFHAPSGCDSHGYTELVTCHGSAGLLALGVFQALCQLAATMPSKLRGKFARTNGDAMPLRQIALLLRIEVCHLEEAVEILTAQEIGWLRWESDSGQSADNLPEACHGESQQMPEPCHESPGFVQGQGKGKGEGQGTPTPPAREQRAPTIEDCETFACDRLPAQKQWAASVARQFHALFSVKDWQTTSGEDLLHKEKWKARLLQMLEEEGRKGGGKGRASHQDRSRPGNNLGDSTSLEGL